MFGKVNLAYLALQVRDLARWRRFATDMLGLPAPGIAADGALSLRLDQRAHRFILRPGNDDDIDALGWEVDSQQDFDAILARAREAGANPVEGDAQAAKARHVQRLVSFIGPDGVRNELVMGLADASTPFASALMPSGFRTGAMGLGHAVLVSGDAHKAAAFYRSVLGMRLSQEFQGGIGPIKVNGVFLHCNPRHHSLALFEMPAKGRMHHVMIEANQMRDLGAAWERAQKLKVPITLTLGQHPEPDGMVSFYGMTPSGFDFEIGAAGQLIDPNHFEPITINVTSDWGHHPTLRAKWNLISAAIAQKFRRKAPALTQPANRP
jgi:2,3-dihydroxybiphenyl 1,2-dioxygenase